MLRISRILLGIALAAGASRAAEAVREVRAGFEHNASPLSSLSADGKPQGFSIELIEAVARAAGLKLKLETGTWQELTARLRQGDLDVLASVAYSPERDEWMDFAATHLNMTGGVFVRKNGPQIKTAEDLAPLRLGVQLGSFSHSYFLSRGWDKNLVMIDSLREGLRLLDAGKCDAICAVSIVGTMLVREEALQNVEFSGVRLPGFDFELHEAVRAGNSDLLYRLNEGLTRVRASGEYDRIYEKWIGPLEHRPVGLKQLFPYLGAVAILLLVVLAVLIWQRSLLNKLARQTAALKESEEQLRHVLDGSEDGFWDWDLATGKMERSERWASMLGYTLEEIVPTLAGGMSLVHPDDVPAYKQWQERLNRGAVDRYDIEYRMKAKSGEWRWILDRGKVVARGPDRQPLRMAGTHTDITERKRTETALRESQALLRRSAQLLEQTQSLARIGGWELDFASGRLFWTRETYRLHETTPEEYQPDVATAIDFYTPESRPIITAAFERTRQTGVPYSLELDVTTARGRRIRVHTTGAVEREGDRITKIYGAFRDITAERNAETEREMLRLKMLEAQKLESLGVLAGGIAHDFNNLLTVILANATFVRDDGRPDDPRLLHIETAARRAADLCRQMLAYAGRGNFVVEATDLSVLVRDTSQLISSSISKKAHLELALAAELPPVEADVSQLRQVVMNLVINASEALGEREGRITVSTRIGRPPGQVAGVAYNFDLPAVDCACLEIRDTGCGMDAATLTRIFDPFFTTKFAGRGLGLAAVLGIVRSHRGALVVESTPGAGSVFQLYLPPAVRARQSASPFSADQPVVHAASGKILVADDEPIVLATADALLRHQGYRTVLAADGLEAVQKFKADPLGFRAVLLDLTMPGLDGAEVLRAIREINPAACVLIMSGYSEQDVLSRLKGLGEVPFLKKPFSREVLLDRLAQAAGSA